MIVVADTSPLNYLVLIDETTPTTKFKVGGVPQAFVMSKEESFPVGTLKGGRRYIFGRNVQSSGHKLRVCYVPYGEEIPLQPKLD